MRSEDKVQQLYFTDLTSNIPKLEKKANQVITSFADLVSELTKVSKLSNGTPVKDQVSKLAGELNNSSVYFAKMISDELGKLHGIIQTPDSSETENLS